MERLDQLERRIAAMVLRFKTLEEENQRLRRELAEEREKRESVLGRIDDLLSKNPGRAP